MPNLFEHFRAAAYLLRKRSEAKDSARREKFNKIKFIRVFILASSESFVRSRKKS